MSGKKQKKQVVLMIAKNFLAYHKRAGKATEFEAKIKAKDRARTGRWAKQPKANSQIMDGQSLIWPCEV